jgi:hypothetical protein
MGICQSPNIVQEAMEDLLRQFEEADVYINDIGVFSEIGPTILHLCQRS